jgi:hypothetical protein
VPAKGKIWVRANFAFCSKKERKIKNYCGAEIGLKKALLMLKYNKIICSRCILFL